MSEPLMFGDDVDGDARTCIGICRGCGDPLWREDVFTDLACQPLANGLLSADQLDHAEIRYPLRPLVCRTCLLVQLPNPPDAAEIFTEGYPFAARNSKAWQEHAARLVSVLIERLGLDATSRVLEIGSNDGTMLRPFAARGIPALGIEPCRDVAEYALRAGLATDMAFWTEAYARGMASEGYRADLVVATNVLAHVPDLGDFLRGVREVLAADGVAVFEVPEVGSLIAECQFDQIYAEHHCYFSLHSLGHALAQAHLQIEDVESLPVHGGSLRIFARPQERGVETTLRVHTFYQAEREAGLTDPQTYLDFARRPAGVKIGFLRRLTALVGSTWGYGASAKAVTLLNYAGVGPELVRAVADTTPAKQGKYMPGCRIPIISPEALGEELAHHTAAGKKVHVVNFLHNWREESEANIRALCPDAQIVYPNEAARLARAA